MYCEKNGAARLHFQIFCWKGEEVLTVFENHTKNGILQHCKEQYIFDH